MIHKLLKRPQAIIGLCLIAIVIVIAIAAPAFSPHDPELVNLSQKYAQPDAEYPLGTDQLGRCTLSSCCMEPDIPSESVYLCC
mgnify:FL=1